MEEVPRVQTVFACSFSLCLRHSSFFGPRAINIRLDRGGGERSSGLAIPGAKITLSSLEDQSTRDAVSNPDGAFQLVNAKPGRYEITAQAQGFAMFKPQCVQLDARQTLRTNLPLKVQSASETVEVGAAAPMINTENAMLADGKDFSQISQLPVNYRGATTSSMAMLATVPGTQQDANGNVSIGGGPPSQVQYSVDGVSTVNIRQNGALANMNPSSELISEFKVAQFNDNAEFAQLGDITIATKSGSEKSTAASSSICRTAPWMLRPTDSPASLTRRSTPSAAVWEGLSRFLV